MLPFRHSIALPKLPNGFIFESQYPPSPKDLNRLLSRCNESTYSQGKLALALENSVYNLSIIEARSGKLSGFVRATSDYGLNINLWNLVADPGEKQGQILVFLVYKSLNILRRDMPGCSISISAPLMSVSALEEQGFLIDPSGIRAMGLRL